MRISNRLIPFGKRWNRRNNRISLMIDTFIFD